MATTLQITFPLRPHLRSRSPFLNKYIHASSATLNLTNPARPLPSNLDDNHQRQAAAAMNSSHNHMTFFVASDTPLLFTWWKPSSTGHYAITCLLLVLLAASFRALLSGKHILERRWIRQQQEKVASRFDHIPLAKYNKHNETSSNAALDADSVEEQVREVNRTGASKQPWRVGVELPRALLVTLISVLGYFLMLAVMTLNVGYFCSVTGGIFAGELLVGRYNHSILDH